MNESKSIQEEQLIFQNNNLLKMNESKSIQEEQLIEMVNPQLLKMNDVVKIYTEYDVYEYYIKHIIDNNIYIGLINEEYTIVITRYSNNKFKLKNVNIKHSITFVNHYNININMYTIKKILPLEIDIGTHVIKIIKIIKKGRNANIYDCIFDNKLSIIKSLHTQNLLSTNLPMELRYHLPIKYLYFTDCLGRHIIIMEKLYNPVYSYNFLYIAIKFIERLDKLKIKHGDIRPNNIMMDIYGRVKIINFLVS